MTLGAQIYTLIVGAVSSNGCGGRGITVAVGAQIYKLIDEAMTSTLGVEAGTLL